MVDLAVKILASMLNKWQDDSFDVLVIGVLEEIYECLENVSIEENVNKLLAWFTKALVMRNSKYGIDLICVMCKRLITVKSLATNFAILLHDNEVLCSQNDCRISLLYRQKITMNCLKEILESRKNDRKLQYNVAILNLLIYLPQQLFVLYFKEVIEVIIECLDSNIPFLCLMALKKIEYIVINEKELFVTYLSDITPILLKLTASDSMEVRLSALKCLEYIMDSPTHLVTPFKVRVIHGLAKCLDDPKRLVRTQAIKTRLAWYKCGNDR
ncbi:MMS19 nucleotide excision repair protein homolog [Chrysoperla carnea]|uniref:MMS19 nucleotide excision repair protein homolog n=1 Tax=Chrysoperla carnea TaxID=189513 RepID=UPI001D093615|nr:MMS19 nucleotide excision repair protein homolog [Chrysoperla carnea]